MKKIISYPITLLFYLYFGMLLLVFHVIMWFSYFALGYPIYNKVVNGLQWMIMKGFLLLGSRFSVDNPHKIPDNKPLILVSNHQSMYDIPPIVWHFRKNHPKFISKKELAKGIPCISFNLRHGGSVAIDRSNPDKALKDIKEFAQRVVKNNWSASIFPEGTRSRTGKPNPFKEKGLQTLSKYITNAVVVPITVNNSWKTMRFGTFPMDIGVHVQLKIHTPIPINNTLTKEEIKEIEATIIKSIL